MLILPGLIREFTFYTDYILPAELVACIPFCVSLLVVDNAVQRLTAMQWSQCSAVERSAASSIQRLSAIVERSTECNATIEVESMQCNTVVERSTVQYSDGVQCSG